LADVPRYSHIPAPSESTIISVAYGSLHEVCPAAACRLPSHGKIAEPYVPDNAWSGVALRCARIAPDPPIVD
jgi:hypothetical protein